MPDFPKLIARKPPAYLLLGNAVGLTLARDIRAASPGTFILLRAQADNWAIDLDWTRGFAERSMAVAAPFQAAGLCDMLLPPNEPVAQNAETAKRLNDCQVLIAGLYKANGYQTGAYNFSVGNPEYALWLYLLEGIRACDGWLLLHEYGAPAMQTNATDLALRHRRVYDLVPSDIRANLKIGITETGIDLGIGRPPDGAPTAGGYRNLPQQGDSENYWIDNYLAQLTWYDGELAKDTYVKFATVFGYGMESPWTSLGFDVAAIDTDRDKFIAWLGSGVVVNPPPPPPPTSTVVPFAGGYTVTQAFGERPEYYAQFSLAGHEGLDLIPQDADWRIYAVGAGVVSRVTVDAAYGNLVVVLDLPNRRALWYAHCASVAVQVGQPIARGDVLGVMGATGNTQGAHLHLGLRECDAAGNAINLNNGYKGFIDPLPLLVGAPAPTGATVITPQEIADSIAFTYSIANQWDLGEHRFGEVEKRGADGKDYIINLFAGGGVVTEKGHYGPGDAKFFDRKTFAISDKPVVVVPPPVVNPPPGGPLPYSFPQALTDIGAVGQEGSPIAGKLFYRLNGASTRTGISAFMVMTVIGVGGIPVVGAQVVNLFPDGHGEVVLTDGSGAARFQFGASSAFTNPGGGPFTVFVAEGAVKDADTKVVTWKFKLSDTIASLGDFGGQHQEIYVQFVKQ